MAYAFLNREGNEISEETLKKIFSKGSKQGVIDPSLLAYVVKDLQIFGQREFIPSLVAYLNKQSVAYNPAIPADHFSQEKKRLVS